MRSGSERMHTWRRTPSTECNFQTLIIWITVSSKASCNGSISVNIFFFLDFFNFCWVFQKFLFFCVTLYYSCVMDFLFQVKYCEYSYEYPITYQYLNEASCKCYSNHSLQVPYREIYLPSITEITRVS